MQVVVVDISNSMTIVINTILNLFNYIFTQMASISFLGTNLLMIFLGIQILGVAMPILITMGKNIVGSSERIRPKRSERNDNEQ